MSATAAAVQTWRVVLSCLLLALPSHQTPAEPPWENDQSPPVSRALQNGSVCSTWRSCRACAVAQCRWCSALAADGPSYCSPGDCESGYSSVYFRYGCGALLTAAGAEVTVEGPQLQRLREASAGAAAGVAFAVFFCAALAPWLIACCCRGCDSCESSAAPAFPPPARAEMGASSAAPIALVAAVPGCVSAAWAGPAHDASQPDRPDRPFSTRNPLRSAPAPAAAPERPAALR